MVTTRLPTPPVDKSDLNANLQNYVSSVGTAKAFDFAVYTGIPIGNGVRGKGLLAVAVLLGILIDSASHVTFTHADLKAAVLHCAFCIDGLWPKEQKRPIDRWASDIAERIFTICNHLRRIRHSPTRLRQCMQDLTVLEQDRLQSIVDRVEIWLADARPARRCSAQQSSSSSSRPSAAPQPTASSSSSRPVPSSSLVASVAASSGPSAPASPVAPSAKRARTLQEQVSLCSVDSDGFPNMLKLHEDQPEDMDTRTVFYADHQDALRDGSCSDTSNHEQNDIEESLLEVPPVPARKLELKLLVAKKPAAAKVKKPAAVKVEKPAAVAAAKVEKPAVAKVTLKYLGPFCYLFCCNA